MLTLAVEDPPVTRRGSFGDFVIRLVAAAVLVASVIGIAVVAVFIFGVHHPLFDEWQVGVVALLIAAPLVGLVLGACYVLRRRHSARGRTRYFRLLVLAVLPGVVVGGWISTVVSSTMADAWLHFSAEGNSHAPAVSSLKNAAPAPASPAARMLTPTDLGAGWYNVAKPNPSLMTLSSQETSEGQTLRVKDFIYREHWTGRLWMNDDIGIEVQDQFDSATKARNYPAIWKAQYPDAPLSQQTIGQTVVVQGQVSSIARIASFAVGDSFFQVQEIDATAAPTAAQFEAVVSAAVARATATT
jgi:hypothetical protein